MNGQELESGKKLSRWAFLIIFVLNRSSFAGRLLYTLTFPSTPEPAFVKSVIWIARALLYIVALVLFVSTWSWLDQFQRMWGIAELIAVALEMPNELLLQGQIAELADVRSKIDGQLAGTLGKLRSSLGGGSKDQMKPLMEEGEEDQQVSEQKPDGPTEEEIKNGEYDEYIRKSFEKKTDVAFPADYYSMTMLTFYKENEKSLEIPIYKQG